MKILDIEITGTDQVVQGDTWVDVTIEGDNDTDIFYSIDIAWTKYPEKYTLEEAYIARVHEIRKGKDVWHEKGAWEQIPDWDEIEEAAMKKFEEWI